MNKEVSCFVINLEKDVDRRVAMSQQLENLGISYSIFGAVYGKKLTPEEVAKHYDQKRAIALSHDMTSSELGCALSHIFIYKKMVEEAIPYALVLEDDARLGNDLPKVISGLCSQYKSTDPVAILLNHVKKYQNRKSLILDEKYRIANIYGTPVRTHGYFITLAAAKKMLDNLYPVWTVADDWAIFNRDFITIKAVVPYCVGLSDLAEFSNIESERDGVKLKRSIGYHLHHFFYHKFINQIFIRPFLQVRKQDETW